MGLVTETFPIFGSRVKSYIFLASLFQFGACLNMGIKVLDRVHEAWMLTFWTWLCFFGMAWVDTIVGGLIVKEARVDLKNGAEDLRYFEWISWGIGGVIPVLIGHLLLY